MTRKGRHPAAFRQMAVERMKRCENIVALSEELGVSRRLLYRWRHQLDPVDGGQEPPPESPRESTLRKENHQLKRVLAEKTTKHRAKDRLLGEAERHQRLAEEELEQLNAPAV